MADKISIDILEYDSSIAGIKKGQTRLDGAYAGFKQSWDKSNLQCLKNYASSMENIKAYLQKYSQLLQQDIADLKTIGNEIDKADNT